MTIFFVKILSFDDMTMVKVMQAEILSFLCQMEASFSYSLLWVWSLHDVTVGTV